MAKSFERIHRSNLVGMGVLPCQFKGGDSVASLGITNAPSFSTQPAMLRICDVAACSGRNSFAPAVVWSPGKNFIAKLGPPPTFGAQRDSEGGTS